MTGERNEVEKDGDESWANRGAPALKLTWPTQDADQHVDGEGLLWSPSQPGKDGGGGESTVAGRNLPQFA